MEDAAHHEYDRAAPRGVSPTREDARLSAQRRRGADPALRPRGEWADRVAPDRRLEENRCRARPAFVGGVMILCAARSHDHIKGELMKNPFVLIAMVAVCSAQLLWASPEAAAQPAQRGPGQYGTVHFPISCRSGVQEQFQRAVAMLHSFFYPEDVKAFEAVTATHPDCALAYWGLATSQRPNPLVPARATENLKRGPEAAPKGQALAETQRERERR